MDSNWPKEAVSDNHKVSMCGSRAAHAAVRRRREPGGEDRREPSPKSERQRLSNEVRYGDPMGKMFVEVWFHGCSGRTQSG